MKHPDSFTADLQKLVVPISDEKPSGESVRYTGTYDQIRQARREDDPGMKQGIWKTELKRADRIGDPYAGRMVLASGVGALAGGLACYPSSPPATSSAVSSRSRSVTSCRPMSGLAPG